MNQKRKVLTILSALTLAGICGGTALAQGEVYTLNPVVVTAQRMEKAELDTPAAVTVISDKKIKDAGYKNVFDAIDSQVGVSSTGYGDAGQDFGFSSGRTIIRGFDRGTLVMVDGIPMNLKNYNSLEGIPLDAVKKIEVLKGVAGTLYGAEAMGGVVNIITKKPGEGKPYTEVKGTIGNYYKDYGVSYAGDNLIVSLSKEYSDKVSHSNAYGWSPYDWKIGKGQKNRAYIGAKFSDELSGNFMFQDGNITRYDALVRKKNDYRFHDKRITTGLHYEGNDNGIKATIGYNYRQVDGSDYGKKARLQSAADLKSYIADVQKDWKIGKDSLIAGYSFRKENYESLYYKNMSAHRDSHAIYLSYDHVFSDKWSAVLGLRGEFIDDPYEDQHILNPQFQTLYKINNTTSWYINVGRAFQMPTVDSYYSKGKMIAASGHLDPEKGWTYETGIKKLFGNESSLKLAVYHMDFENKFGWSDKDPYTQEQHAINKGDFRNTGIEAEFNRTINSHWDYSIGIGFSNPEVKDKSKEKEDWKQDSARIDGTASLRYKNNKFRSTLSYKYLGDRENYVNSKGKDFGQVPSTIRFTWNSIYDVTPNDSITLTLNNLFDHDNFANKYGNLELPYNWRLSYSHKF